MTENAQNNEAEQFLENIATTKSEKLNGIFTVIFLSLFMPYMHLRTAIIYGSVIYGFVALSVFAKWYTEKLKREIAVLQARKEQLLAEREQLNARLFGKFGKYTNEYGYGKSSN